MAEERTKILELDTETFENLKQGGFLPVSVQGHTYKVALSEFGDAGTNDHKVCVENGDTPRFLADALVSDSDELTFTALNGILRIGLNLTGESDPKLGTMPESNIDSETSNYGSYQLKQGAQQLEWGDVDGETFDYCNAMIYQCTRISDAQGTISKCNVALAGTLASQNACLCIGVFDMEGNLLGHTGLRRYGVDFTQSSELCTFDMQEMFQGALKIKRNTRYIVQVWSVGVQLAAKSRTNYNYQYDYTLRQNLETTLENKIYFVNPLNTNFNTASKIPFISFGASTL